MKSLLVSIVGGLVVVGCGESQQSTTPAETQPTETVAAATQPELPTDVSNRKLIKIFGFHIHTNRNLVTGCGSEVMKECGQKIILQVLSQCLRRLEESK